MLPKPLFDLLRLRFFFAASLLMRLTRVAKSVWLFIGVLPNSLVDGGLLPAENGRNEALSGQ